MSTRPASPADSEFAFETRKAAFRPVLERVATWDEAAEQEQHARRFATHEFAVLERDGDDVGIAALARRATEIRLYQLFVLPAHQSRGIGAEYMRELLEQARGAGLPVRLRVLSVNQRAIAFYERLGFEKTGTIELHTMMEKAT